MLQHDLSGRSFGRWTVLSKAESDVPVKNTRWTCRCECGSVKDIPLPNLRGGISKSCGCLNRERLDEKVANGYTKTTEWVIWRNVHNRCYKKSDPAFHNYGARGILVCERWHKANPDGFKNFLVDMGRRPSAMHSIERKNNSLGYGPDNCEWALASIQARNRRTTKMLEYQGKIQCQKDWAEYLGITEQSIIRRMQKGEAFAEICARPRRRAA